MSGGWSLDEGARAVLRAYAARRISRGAAAEHLHVSEETVTDWMHRLGMSRAPVAGPRCADCRQPVSSPRVQRCRRCDAARKQPPASDRICPRCGGMKSHRRTLVCWSCDLPRRRQHGREISRRLLLTGR